MNRQGNLYTIVYTAVIVCVVGAALAWVSLTLKPKQNDNIRIDKMQQMLSSIRVVSDETNAIELYGKYVVDEYVINSKGERQEGKAFDVNVANEVKKEPSERQLPVFVCNIDNSTKYILPVYGTGLWGPIWGYVSVDDDGCTVYGAYFSHQGETPGLGAEIATEGFAGQFKGKQLQVGSRIEERAEAGQWRGLCRCHFRGYDYQQGRPVDAVFMLVVLFGFF